MPSDNDLAIAQRLGEVLGKLDSIGEEMRARWDAHERDDDRRAVENDKRWAELQVLITERGVRLRTAEKHIFAIWIGLGALLTTAAAWVQQHWKG